LTGRDIHDHEYSNEVTSTKAGAWEVRSHKVSWTKRSACRNGPSLNTKLLL